jgi:hypothetical protein
VRSLVAGEKPVAITGFGASGYVGAGDRGARAMEIVEYDEATQAPLRLDGEYTRDEAGQAAKDARRPPRSDLPRHDLEPKAAFTAVADCYRG